MLILLSVNIFSNLSFLKNSLGNTIRVSNCLDPDQARHSVGRDLVPTSFQRSWNREVTSNG